MSAAHPGTDRDPSLSRGAVHGRLRRAVAGLTTLTLGVGVIAALLTGAQGVLAVPKAAAADVSSVQTLYAADLVSRIDAERAARGTFGLDIPQLAVDAGLQAYAQSWS